MSLVPIIGPVVAHLLLFIILVFTVVATGLLRRPLSALLLLIVSGGQLQVASLFKSEGASMAQPEEAAAVSLPQPHCNRPLSAADGVPLVVLTAVAIAAVRRRLTVVVIIAQAPTVSANEASIVTVVTTVEMVVAP